MPLVKIPFLDKAATAGRPVPIDDDLIVTSYRWIPSPFGSGPEDKHVGVYITGDSLTDHRIYDGDWVICRLAEDAENGQMVFVVTPHGPTVKFWHRRHDGTVALESSNRLFSAQTWLETELTVKGIAVMMGRDLVELNQPREVKELEYVEDYG